MEFLGLFLAEGSFGGHKRHIQIAQSSESTRRKEIEGLLSRMPFKYYVQKSGAYQINSVQLCSFLSKLGLGELKATGKFIPKHIKEFHPKYLLHLIYGFALGDGNWHKRTKQMTLTTSSKKLADDLQEIIIKCGWIANIREVQAKGTKSIGGYVRRSNVYFLSIRKEKMDYYLDNRVIGKEFYEDKIWDVEVEDWHTILVRRNGKPFFSGNCRFGYPTISIMMEGILNPWGDFLHSISSRQKYDLKAKKGFQIGVVIAVPPFPFNDPAAFKRYSEDAAILFKKPNLGGVHLGDVKFAEEDWRLAGNSGYALVITGSGSTVDGARKQAYHRVRNIMIPNMFYRTDIGLRWYYDSDKLQTWGYIY
jgi:phosphoribosylamine--glycine ligase